MLEMMKDLLLSAAPVVVIGVSLAALFSTMVIFRVATTILNDADKRLDSLDRMEFGVEAYNTGRIPNEGAAPEIAPGHGPSGYYDGNGIVFHGQKTIAGRIL